MNQQNYKIFSFLSESNNMKSVNSVNYIFVNFIKNAKK